MPYLKRGFYAFNDIEESTDNVEFLDNADDFDWVKSDGKNIQNAAIVSGFQVGRALQNGNLIVGRVDPYTKQLIGSYNGENVKLSSFDLLVKKSKGNYFHINTL